MRLECSLPIFKRILNAPSSLKVIEIALNTKAGNAGQAPKIQAYPDCNWQVQAQTWRHIGKEASHKPFSGCEEAARLESKAERQGLLKP